MAAVGFALKERQNNCLFTTMTSNACDGVCAAVLCLSFLVLAGGTACNDWLNARNYVVYLWRSHCYPHWQRDKVECKAAALK